MISDLHLEGYRMVFASICEHASSILIFSSTSSCQMFLAGSEHFRKIEMASSENFEYFVNFPLPRISLLLIGYVVFRQLIANNLTHTSKTEQQMQNWGGSTSCSILQLCPRLVWSRGRCYVKRKKLLPLCTFLKFHTHLEEN